MSNIVTMRWLPCGGYHGYHVVVTMVDYTVTTVIIYSNPAVVAMQWLLSLIRTDTIISTFFLSEFSNFLISTSCSVIIVIVQNITLPIK